MTVCPTINCDLLGKIMTYIQTTLSPNPQTSKGNNIIGNIFYGTKNLSSDYANYLNSKYINPPPPQGSWSSADASTAIQNLKTLSYDVIDKYEPVKRLAAYKTYYNLIGESYLPLTACSSSTHLLAIDTPSLAYLWEITYCRVNNGELINYGSVTDYPTFVDNPAYQLAAQAILNGFVANLRFIDSSSMENACQSLSYDSLSVPEKKNLCGCYTTLPPQEYVADEISATDQNPECLPSCLSASVRRVSGGQPITCNQSTCIIDNIVTNATNVSITNACPMCVKNKQCICYIHVNNVIISNESVCKTTNTVSDVGPDGKREKPKITNTTTNSEGTDDSKAFDLKVLIIIAAVLAALLFVIIGVVLIIQHRKSKSNASRTPSR